MNKISKQLYGEYGKYSVYLIDPQIFRNTTLDDEEFGDYAIHQWFPKKIPNNEIWVDKNLTEVEILINISTALTILKNLELGKSEHIAYTNGLKIARKLRENLFHQKLNIHQKPPKDLYIKKYGKIDDLTVYLVNGIIVRNLYKTDFIEGGNPEVYKWIPRGEIWIEDDIDEKEIPYIVLHEITEYTLMKDKHIPYNKAHKIASKVEFVARQQKSVKNFTIDK